MQYEDEYNRVNDNDCVYNFYICICIIFHKFEFVIVKIIQHNDSKNSKNN